MCEGGGKHEYKIIIYLLYIHSKNVILWYYGMYSWFGCVHYNRCECMWTICVYECVVSVCECECECVKEEGNMSTKLLSTYSIYTANM